MNSRASPPRYWLVGLVAGLACLYLLFAAATLSEMIAMHSLTHPQAMTATSALPQSDFARFWYVGRSLDGGQAIRSAWFKQTFQIDILDRSARLAIWLYPPTMNLLAMLFAGLPLKWSFWAWRLACWAAAAYLLRVAGLSWIVIAAGLLSPAGLHDTLSGQNGTLVGAMLVSALLMIDRRPRAAGVIAGLLCIKPQMAIVIPFTLLPERIITIGWCALTVLAAMCLSILILGVKPWIWFFEVAQPMSRQILENPPAGGYTVFLMIRSFHVALGWAAFGQAVCSLVSGAAVWRLWRGGRNNPTPRMAATISLATLMTPYGFFYDLTGYAIAMAAMVAFSPPRQKLPFAILWLASGYTVTLTNLTGLLLFPVIAIFAALLSIRLIDHIDGNSPIACRSNNRR